MPPRRNTRTNTQNEETNNNNNNNNTDDDDDSWTILIIIYIMRLKSLINNYDILKSAPDSYEINMYKTVSIRSYQTVWFKITWPDSTIHRHEWLLLYFEFDISTSVYPISLKLYQMYFFVSFIISNGQIWILMARLTHIFSTM